MANEVNIDKSQAQMDDQFIREYTEAVGPGGNFNEFLADWGMSENDVIDYLESNPQILPKGYVPHYEGYVGETDSDDRTDEEIEMGDPDSYNDFIPDYSKTAEYEGTGITSELIPGEGLVAPILTGMGVDPTTAAVIGSVATKKPGMLTNKLFAGKNLKKNQLKNRGAEGPVVTGTSRTAKGTNLRPAIKQKTADRYKSMSDRVKGKRVGEAATVAGAGTAMYLAGDTPDDEIVTGHPPVNNPYEEPKTQSRDLTGSRDANGNLMTVDADRERYAKEGKVIFTHANGSYAFAEPGSDMADELMAQEYFAGDIAAQNAGKSQSNTGSDWSKAKGEVKKEEPKGEDVTKEERPGWHKREGANFWTVNNDSPHWQTDEGAEEAKEIYGEYPAWVKQPKVQELDWSGWFN
jgi:hypothetical protein